jgi:aspartate racemase
MVGGFSMGGEVAFEIAQQLHTQGQEVALVALLDTHNPEFARRRNNVLRMAEGSEDETAVSGEEVSEFGEGLLNNLRLLKRWAILRYKLARMDLQKYKLFWRVRRLLRAGETLPQSLISPFLWKSHIDLVNNHNPKPYLGRVTLFRASETEVGNPSGDDIGWAPLAQNGLDVHIIHGTHNIVKEPYVAELARLLKLSIDKAIQNS